MKKKILASVLVLGSLATFGQKGLNDGYFGMFTDEINPEIDCSTGSHDVMMIQRCMTRDFIDNDSKDKTRGINLQTYTYVVPDNTSGLTYKVARGIAAQRPRRSSSSSGYKSYRVGNYNNAVENAHFAAERRAQMEAARREAERRRRWEEQQRKIAEDNRAAAVTAQTNALLQGQTNARIASDQWNATEGAKLAQQRARQAMVKPGAQFDRMKPKSSGSQQASRLRGYNKPRRVMAAKPVKRNTARRALQPVNRKTSKLSAHEQQLRQQHLQRAIEMRKKRQLQLRNSQVTAQNQKQAKKSVAKKNPAAYYNKDTKLVLDSHAQSSLGKDWGSIDLKPVYAPSVKRKMTEEERHKLIVIEMIDQRPLTAAEEKYYENLTL